MSRYTRFTLSALVDAFPLAAQRFDPPPDVPVRAAVVISCATGIHAGFYRDFSFWLASQGVGTITYDYRYTGGSWPPHLLELVGPSSTPESRARALRAAPEDIGITSHWAQRDAAAAIRYASERWASVPLTSLGHSLGGMMLPLYPSELPRITRLLNVCGGNLHVGNYPNPSEVLTAFRQLIAPYIETERIFYGSRMGFGEDLPYGPGKEWLQFFLSPRCAQWSPEGQKATREMNKPYLWIGFEDDVFCTKKLMYQHMPQFSHADGQKASLWIDPSAHHPPWPSCGHTTSFMKSKSTSTGDSPSLTRAETIWSVYKDWIVDGKVDESVGEYRVWKPEDEFDPAERAEIVYELVERDPSKL